jgi:hypothetical protein
MLKIVEVVVLIGAGVCFVVWQFRDLRKAREITRQQREAERDQAMNVKNGSLEDPVKRDTRGE